MSGQRSGPADAAGMQPGGPGEHERGQRQHGDDAGGFVDRQRPERDRRRRCGRPPSRRRWRRPRRRRPAWRHRRAISTRGSGSLTRRARRFPSRLPSRPSMARSLLSTACGSQTAVRPFTVPADGASRQMWRGDCAAGGFHVHRAEPLSAKPGQACGGRGRRRTRLASTTPAHSCPAGPARVKSRRQRFQRQGREIEQ